MEDQGDQPPREPQPSAEQDLSAIFARLDGGKRWRQELYPEVPVILQRVQNNDDAATKFARSEEFVERAELPQLNQKVDAIRRQILAQGKNIRSHPTFEETQEAENLVDEDLDNSFWDIRDGFDVSLDQYLPEESTFGARLGLLHQDPERNITTEIEFGFDNDFRLAIAFAEPQEPGGGLAYNSSNFTSSLSLDKMTAEEHRIISNQLERYLQARDQPEDEDPS